MYTRTLGLIGILCSPFLAIQLKVYGLYDHAVPTSMAGLLGLIYMTGWFCSILGLYHVNAAGRIILVIQMILLTIGNLWNIYSIFDPQNDSLFFHITDLIGWPLDNLFMLATGIAVLSAKKLQGWKRYVPLFVGCWFPITMPLLWFVFGSSNSELMIISAYSIIGWSLLGLTVYLSGGEQVKSLHYNTAPVVAFEH